MSKKCLYCGAVLEDDDKFCDECGKRQDGPVVKEQKKTKKKKKWPILLLIPVVLVLLLLAMCGRSSKSSDNQEAVLPEPTTKAEKTKETKDRKSSQTAESEKPRESEKSSETDNSASSQAAEAELMGYVDQMEALYEKLLDDLGALNSDEGLGIWTKRIALIETILSDLSNLQKQTEAVGGIDTVLADAVDEYFSMIYDSLNGYREVWVFISEYLEFVDYIEKKPRAADSESNYYQTLNEWYESTKEAYAAIDSCPACMEDEWKRYGEILDLNKNISTKLHWAEAYNDNLRWQSAMNMSERFDTEEMLQYEKFMNCLYGERDHVTKQRNISSRLAQELHAYVELDAKKRDGYEFENIRTGKIFIGDDAFEAVDTIYPSLYNTYDAFLIIKTGCVSGTRDIVVEAEIPGFTQNYKESFRLDSTYREIKIKPPALTGELNLSSTKDAQLRVSITEKDGTTLVEKSFPVTIKSKYDFEWISDDYGIVTKDNILCFLTPESSALVELKRQAINEISSLTDGRMESFVGYQNNPWNNHYVGTYLQAAGIMQALHNMGIRYNMTTFSISNSNQRIMLPDDVLQQQSGLCIETSLVVASALQSAGMHAYIVLPPGHAQVAVEIWNGSGSDTTGTGQYLLIETTNLNDNRDAYLKGIETFLENKGPGSGPIVYKNREGWKEYLAVEGTYLIDCDDSRVFGLTPFVN